MRSVPFRFYIAALLLAIAAPLVAGLGYVAYRGYEESRNDAERVVLRSAQLSAARTAGFLRESEDILRALAQYPRLRAIDPRQCGSLLEAVNELLKYRANVITRDAAGNLVCTAVPPRPGERTHAADPYYLEEVLRAGKFVVGKPVRRSILGEWVVEMGYPLRDAGGGVVGVVALALDLAKFHEIASSVALIDGAATQIITGDGIVIASSQDGKNAVGRNARHIDALRKAPTASAGTALALDAAGTERIYGIADVPGTDWRVYAGTPAEAVFARSRRGLQHNVLIIIAIIALAAPLSVFLARKVIKSVGNIAGAPVAVAAGNRTARADPAGPSDVTRRIEAEKALRKNYELLDRIFATTHFCVVYLDRDLNFVWVNKAYADACGHPPEFFPGKNHFALYPGEKVEAIFRRVVATGESFTIYANPFEFPDHPERGVTYWDWTLHPLRGEGGDVEGLLFVLLDVTERKRAEVERAQLAAIVESSNDAILTRGLDRTILSWNSAAERLFGWTAQEAVGQSIDLIIPPERIGAMRPFIERAARGEEVSPVENINLHKDGSRIPTQVTFSAIKDGQGNVVAYSFSARDITELKRNEETLRTYATRLRKLSRRLQEVGETERRAISRELHDRIGQGLTTLGLMVGALDARLSRESRSAVQTLLKDMQALQRYVVAHVRDVMAELRPPVLDDYGLLAALRQLVTEFANRTGIAVNLGGVDPYPRLPLIVETAMFRISQEALNNIAKHAHAKKVEINLNAVSDQVMLDIADDGSGFNASNTPDGGEHWGMITMRERAEAAGITFGLESAPGAGTRIVLEVEREAS